MKRNQKKVLAIAACAAVAAGIGVSLAFIFKSGNGGGNTLSESSSVSIEENSSADSITDNGVDTTLTLSETFEIKGGLRMMNMFINGTNPTAEAEPQDLSKGIELTLDIAFNAEVASGAKPQTTNAAVYVFCNGYIIPHSKSESDEPSEKTVYELETGGAPGQINISTRLPIYIPPVSVGSTEDSLLWVYVDFFPDYLPSKEATQSDEPNTAIMWDLPVCSSGEPTLPVSVTEADKSSFLQEIPTLEGFWGAALRDFEYEIYADAGVISGEDSYSIVTYYAGGHECYFIAMCDGEPCDAFGGSKFLKTVGDENAQVVKTPLDTSYMKGGEAHCYKVIALPTEFDDKVTGQKAMMSAIGNDRRISNNAADRINAQ